MLRTKIAMLAAVSAAGLAIGFAAPATADDVGIQAVVGTAYSNNAGTQNATALDDTLLNVCQAVGAPAITAESALNSSTSRTIRFYTNAATCGLNIPTATLLPGATLTDIPASTYYRVT